jgi:CelD/BcsL family acetyltransferase involved in cellulose biosynthesis
VQSALVRGIDGFLELESEWNRLSSSVKTSHYTQTFEWAKLGWDALAQVKATDLICATVWSGERLVAVWPLLRDRVGFARRLEPLGCGMQEEYGDPLIATDVDATRACNALLRLLPAIADLLRVPFVQQGGPMQRALSKIRPFNIAEPMSAYAIERRGFGDLDALLKTYSANFRSSLRQQRRRLQRQGDLQSGLIEDEPDCVEAISWAIREKRQWVLRQDKRCDWLAGDATSNVFVAASTKRSVLGRGGVYRLALDGRPVAVLLITIDRTRVELMATMFDPEFARFSPGMLIIEDVARWAFERGLDVDLRPLHMDFKERWSNSVSVRVKCRVPMTLKGVIWMLPDYALFSLKRLGRRISSAEQRATIRRLLKWGLRFRSTKM